MSTQFALKDHFVEGRDVNNRLIFAAVFSAVLFLGLFTRLVFLQVFEHEHFTTLSNNNRIDIEDLPPQRGLIFDRNGVVLAENIPVFSLEMIPEQVDDIEQTLQELALLFAMTEDEILAIKKQVKSQRNFRQVIIRQRLTEQEVASFSVNRHRLTGVDVVGRLTRHYPHGALFAHTIGYVGRINKRDEKRIDKQNYKGTLHIGKTGIEKQYENFLHGQVGSQQVETNVRGRVVRSLERLAPVAGSDLFLHLDLGLQRVAAEALADYNGAVIALDPKTGGVLAMVSKPDFDPNSFVNGISTKDYALLNTSTDRPLFDRALRGYYPPGSTLKPFVALAGLELGVINKTTTGYCPGWYSLPNQKHRYRCWKKHGHGSVDVTSAISQSCDVYFYDLAHSLGIDRLHGFLDLFGFGHRTGVDIPSEGRGLSPSREWKRDNRNKAWYPGETLISGIGQGFNQTTPIQLAYATAILAMRGAAVRPSVMMASRAAGQDQLQLSEKKLGEDLPIEDSKQWETIIDAMEDVTHGSRGTARHIAKGLPFKMAGKTGTAQVFGIKQDEEYNADELDRKLHDHALFIAFAPVDDPQIVLAIVVEHGGSGSRTAAPIARKMIDQYFMLDNN